MARIERKEVLTPQIVRMEILAPAVVAKRRAGQFVILRLNEKGERIPLTIVDSDPARGTITIVFQVVGKTTTMLSLLDQGDEILDVAGPLGKPTEIERVGTVAVIGGGIGIAVAYPIAKAMKEAGNRVISIVGARTRDLLVLEKEMEAVSDRIIVTTDDGSYKRKGLVTGPLRELLKQNAVDRVIAIGPVPMMEAVSLNPIMVDGTGMCGACRVMIGGRTKFACVDGPEFDGHQVDFADLATRLGAYKDKENHSLAIYQRTSSPAPDQR